jgi:hypothetical protein
MGAVISWVPAFAGMTESGLGRIVLQDVVPT